MHSTYILFNIVPLGFLILLVYIFIDVLLDFFRKVKKSNLKRVILYSFIFYLMCLIQMKIGGFTHPQNPTDNSRTFISTNDWFGIFDELNFNISIWSYSAVLYNVILLVPLGIYLFILFKLKSNKKAISIVVLSCVGIEIFRLLFDEFGLVLGGFNALTIINLLINIVGGITGFIIAVLTLEMINSYKNISDDKEKTLY
ncbi:VanZ family protein [Paenisporosarcina indica]|uniref:VanZ family protein n=1 Tax=Paenisporosarcina indica TaxID=650093 RepID=UPI00094F8F3B|nr:VanZ family protein [Paenisporosarcina indica]